MPTYQYACTACDHSFEQFQSFSDDTLTTCPECEGRLRKIFNAVGVVFKGSGFYRTDNRASTSTPPSSSSSEKSSSEKSGSEKSSKPAAASTSSPSSSSSSSSD